MGTLRTECGNWHAAIRELTDYYKDDPGFPQAGTNQNKTYPSIIANWCRTSAARDFGLECVPTVFIYILSLSSSVCMAWWCNAFSISGPAFVLDISGR